MCTNLQTAKIVSQGDVCRQGRRWENQSSSDNKEVSEGVQTYKLQRLCHRVMFAGKEGDGKINQVETTRGQSVYKLTSCIDCATWGCLQERKEMEKSIIDKLKSKTKGSECAQTYHNIVPQGVVYSKQRDGCC